MEDSESFKTKSNRNNSPNAGNILQSSWIRRTIKTNDRFDGWLLEWNFHFLPLISILLYILFYCC